MSHKLSLLDRSRAGVRLSGCLSVCPHFQTSISRNQQADRYQFFTEASLGRGEAALSFLPNRARTLVSMATDSSHRVIMGENLVTTVALSFLIGSSLFLQVTGTSITSKTSSKLGQIGSRTAEFAALERLGKSAKTYNGKNIATTLAHSFLIESSSFLQVMRTCIKAWMSSNF